jgi:quinol monooxygenase YgiN
MYGTVARIKIKPGTFEKFQAWSEEQSQASSDGAVAVTVFQTNEDPDQLYMVVVFKDEESYYANADRPETNANYEKMAQYFADEPQWYDGEVVYYQQYQ